MNVRTIKSTVTFNNPFTLSDFKETFPAGSYEVETDEELIEGLSFWAYRRIRSVIHLPGKSKNPVMARHLTIDPNALDVALERDQSRGAWLSEPAHNCNQLETSADREALDRADDEGMIPDVPNGTREKR
ncbi:hypothetical protein [Aestuariispira insulae]|uniref:Uncharacterized protein n=1 Tax=Aestuariispira insulae TaxID=1461337 RepID=A0A3D9H0P4_9PROT|nr:hypothetical protein [Aestuariispira insulae]RED43073.1 hypothetical protein DFP90_1403 [Aestuariispira insulae]